MEWVQNKESFSDPKYKDVKFSSIYLPPSDKVPASNSSPASIVPLIVWPHGGPHAISLTSYNKDVSFFNKLGYGVLLVIFVNKFFLKMGFLRGKNFKFWI